MKFKVGDKVRINYPQSDMHGRETTIRRMRAHGRDHKWQDFVGAEVNIPRFGAEDFPYFVFPYDNLEPLTPPKQFEAITWDEACFDRNGKYRQPEYAGVGA